MNDRTNKGLEKARETLDGLEIMVACYKADYGTDLKWLIPYFRKHQEIKVGTIPRRKSEAPSQGPTRPARLRRR